MTEEEKKRYIMQHWHSSNGKRITEMLKRYFLTTDESVYKFAENLFNGKN